MRYTLAPASAPSLPGPLAQARSSRPSRPGALVAGPLARPPPKAPRLRKYSGEEYNHLDIVMPPSPVMFSGADRARGGQPCPADPDARSRHFRGSHRPGPHLPCSGRGCVTPVAPAPSVLFAIATDFLSQEQLDGVKKSILDFYRASKGKLPTRLAILNPGLSGVAGLSRPAPNCSPLSTRSR